MNENTYLIWSNEHEMWWRAAGNGYTHRIADAGVYSRAKAVDICSDAFGGGTPGHAPPELPVRWNDVRFLIIAEGEPTDPVPTEEPEVDEAIAHNEKVPQEESDVLSMRSVEREVRLQVRIKELEKTVVRMAMLLMKVEFDVESRT